MEYRHVVTSFLQRGQLILLLRRSSQVDTYIGRWGAVSGSLERNEDLHQRAELEISEETALASKDITLVRAGELLRVYDQEKNIVWIVHPFLFAVLKSTIKINWEHSEYKWIEPAELTNFETVPRLREAFDRVHWDLSNPAPNLSTAIAIVDAINSDRDNGASYLGRKAVDAIHTAALDSTARTSDELFKDILSVAMRMQHVQPSMASIRNTTGRLLHNIDSARQTSKSVTEYKKRIGQIVREAQIRNENAVERVSRNLTDIITQKKRILTHSYSSTIKRAIQQCSNRELHVYVTESGPAFEGKTLARDLRNLGFNSTVLPDTTTRVFQVEFDAVVLGADSVLTDGSIINKAGTADIALTARQSLIPVYVVAERSKLDCMHFLGSPISLNESFDITRADHITSLITEDGEMKPSQVRDQIKSLVRELYT